MNITIARKNNEQCIAYTNNNQNIFIMYKDLDKLPYIADTLIIESSQKNISDVLEKNYAFPVTFQNITVDIGVINKFIWKPGLHDNLSNVLDYTEYEKNVAKRDLKILLEKTQEIINFIEPSSQSLQAYSYKLRELLILSCTEVENILRFYTPNSSGKILKTTDYVQILQKVALGQYKISFVDCVNKFACKPFENWNSSSATQSIPWYDAYNKVKHDKANNFKEATFENCLNAVAAVIVLFCIRYSPYVLYHETDNCSALFKNSIEVFIENVSIDDIYVPILNGEKTRSGPFFASYSFDNDTQINDIMDKINIDGWKKI